MSGSGASSDRRRSAGATGGRAGRFSEPAGAGVRSGTPRPPTALNPETLPPDEPRPSEALGSLLGSDPLGDALPPPALVDAWPGSEPFRLDGWFERSGFTPFWAGVLVFVVAFVVFQLVGLVAISAGIAADVARGSDLPDVTDTAGLVGAYPHLVLGGNALGQALAFGLVAWGAARLSTRRAGAFLRLDLPEPAGLGLAVVGWVALVPAVVWLGGLNERLPVPDWLRGPGAVLTEILFGGELSTAFLFVTVALTPAVFEELLFRGYLMRQAERRFGSRAAIVGVGVAFGIYHLSVTQAAPLAVLGVYMCFVVWATGSVWTGVVVHLLNNGVQVIAAGVARGTPGFDPDSLGEAGGPWYVALGLAAAGSVAVFAVGRVLLARRTAATGGRPDAQPVLPSDLSSAAPVAVPS